MFQKQTLGTYNNEILIVVNHPVNTWRMLQNWKHIVLRQMLGEGGEVAFHAEKTT